MSHIPPSSGSVSGSAITVPSAKPAPVNTLEKLARFLGFRKVQVVHSEARLVGRGENVNLVPINQREVHKVPVNASIRSGANQNLVVEFTQNYIGHRANQKNIATLMQDLVNSGPGRRSNESDEEYTGRVKEALVNSGIARFGDSGEVLSRRRANHPITSLQLHNLTQQLSAPDSGVPKTVDTSAKPDSFSLLKDGPLLGASAGRGSIKSADDFYGRQALLREYLVNGEGNARLKELGLTDSEQIGSFLPDFAQDQIPLDEMDILLLDHSLRTVQKEGGVTGSGGTSQINYVKDANGGLVKEVGVYDPDNADMRCLALLQEMYSLNTAYCDRLLDKNADDDEKCEDIRLCKANITGAFIAASHCLMRHALPEQMKPESYTYTVLRNSEGITQWSSDMAQPRKQWADELPIEPRFN